MADLGPLYAGNDPHPHPLPEGKGTKRATTLHPGIIAAVVLLGGLIVAPLWWHHLDVQFCWFRWAAGSGGRSPGAIYRNITDCNYPPVVIYLFTATQWLKLHFAWAARTRVEVALLKLPNLLAVLAGAAVVGVGLRPLVGREAARRAACGYLLCPALLVDAAVWGQYEAIMVLGMVGAVVLLLRDRPGWAGVCLGFALAVKLQAFVVIPALTVYAGRRLGLGAVGKAAGAAAATVVLIAVPAVAGGGGVGVWNSYAKAVNYYRELTVYAPNVWEPVVQYREHVLHVARSVANNDVAPIVGPLTPKQIGMSAFLGYTAGLMLGLWRRPDRHGLVLAATLTAFAFFMLPTQIHERYVVPAVALLVLLTPRGDRRWYAVLATVAAVDLLVDIYASNLRFDHVPAPHVMRGAEWIYLLSVAVNAVVFVGLSADFFHRALFAAAGNGGAPSDAWTETAGREATPHSA